jgi:hypothetical protein
MPTLSAASLRLNHGETADNPSPVPSVKRISEKDAAMNAPPATAAQETPVEKASFLPGISVRFIERSAIGRATVAGCMYLSRERLRYEI